VIQLGAGRNANRHALAVTPAASALPSGHMVV
jgi:hypothetical protein